MSHSISRFKAFWCLVSCISVVPACGSNGPSAGRNGDQHGNAGQSGAAEGGAGQATADPNGANQSGAGDGPGGANNSSSAPGLVGPEPNAGGAGGSRSTLVCGAVEVCGNGLDDNCDGHIEEGCTCLPGTVQPCYSGPAANAGKGVCTMGKQTCLPSGEFGTWDVCVGYGTPQPLDCTKKPGADFDCDGLPDPGCNCILGETRDCYDGPTGTGSIAPCKTGTQTCVATEKGSGFTPCAGQLLPKTELCDGKDYDCDGLPNTGCGCTVGEIRSCYEGPAGTADIGRCKSGSQVCVSPAPGVSSWGPCSGQVKPSTELCDDADYDCDGVRNTGCACAVGETRACYSGKTGTENVSFCHGATQVCSSPSPGVALFGACDGEVLPRIELCDGKDYDCDGLPNSGCGCTIGEVRSCYDGPAATESNGLCHAGSQVCVSQGIGQSSWGACNGQALPSQELCNGFDQDCDGQKNTGCGCTVGEKRSCYEGRQGTEGKSVCHGGTQLCISPSPGVALFGTCDGQVLPTVELCDGADHDCDGVPNTGCGCTVGESRSCYDGPANTQSTGLCRPGAQVCKSQGPGQSSWGTCNGQTLPDQELCDGSDRDCDGTSNTGCVCTVGDVRDCYDGRDGTDGVSVCHRGKQKCISPSPGVSLFGACEGQVLPAIERCDGGDYDCDGIPNTGCGCTIGETRACYDGPPATIGVSICHSGSQVCISPAPGIANYGPCTGQVLPSDELCDGSDYDCDGTPNTGCVCQINKTRACYDGAPQTSGVGACHSGAQTCMSGGRGLTFWGTCQGQVLPSLEICDGTDYDCDGATSQSCVCKIGDSQACYEGTSATRHVGACQDGAQNCVVGAAAGSSKWNACSGQILPAVDVCDGVDNDCDGTKDNGCVCQLGAQQSCYSGPAGTAAVGVCRRGAQQCVAGSSGGSNWTTCSGEVVPATEVCGNGLDDNCNGQVDETCGAIVCPAEVSVPAGSAVSLVATGTNITAWAWTVTSGPSGGSTSVVWSPTPAASATESFKPIIVGDYTIQVTGTVSTTNSVSCTTRVHALPHGFRVELTWNGSGDVDLHLHNANATKWFDGGDDCYYSQLSVSWGAVLDLDNTSSNGPENIRIDVPTVNSAYTIGVHNYTRAAGRIATIRIFCGADTTAKATYVSRALTGNDTGNSSSNDFWKVAKVNFTTISTCDVTPIDTYQPSSNVNTAF